MKKFMLAAFAAVVSLSVTGCQALQTAEKTVVSEVEGFVKAPPQVVLDAAHAGLNFLESVLGAVLTGLFHGLLPL